LKVEVAFFLARQDNTTASDADEIGKTLWNHSFDLDAGMFVEALKRENRTMNRAGYALVDSHLSRCFDWRSCADLFDHRDAEVAKIARQSSGTIEFTTDETIAQLKDDARAYNHYNGSGESLRDKIVDVGFDRVLERIAHWPATMPFSEWIELPFSFFWTYRAEFDLERVALATARRTQGMPVPLFRVLSFLNTADTIGATIEGLGLELAKSEWRLDGWAFHELGASRDPRRLPAILAAADNFRRSVHSKANSPSYVYFQTARMMIASAIGKERSDEGRAILCEALRSDSSHVQWVAATALGVAGNRDALADLLQLLRAEKTHATYEQESVAVAAAVAIERLLENGAGVVSPSLRHSLESEGDCPTVIGEDPPRSSSYSLAKLRALAGTVANNN
jgi:hypothetical protein